ncbi:helix-turn-helix transcriptional regulator [Methylorubrum extorquens]|uniref:helix-turn-helix transcriptional regulator n=1 Tax=Methylorubrum extorquens TaxID=408 RepID=UPI001EE559DE|nr:substrate-binding domain-containing protein [Methylorubrum extorquens]MCG5244900.1 helix-turn-helix transcriptional regulator [Methylorubrum extorquens]
MAVEDGRAVASVASGWDGLRVRLHVEGRCEGASDFALRGAHQLLEALGRTGSLQGAAEVLSISYRSAWGQLDALEQALGQPVVVKTKGHGSSLTPLGVAMLTLLQASQTRLAPALAAEEMALTDGLRRLLEPSDARIRLAASHDPLLLEAVEARREIDLMVAGSLDALARLHDESVDAAGFHYGSDGPPPAPFGAVFERRDLVVIPLFRREQGLMRAAGNPLDLGSVADIAARRARFVNRQRGAGTRIWFERLCDEAGIDLARIIGHQTEEFTHQAVAALIATGAADVGMGTRVVAERFALDFQPVGWETYFLAMRARIDTERLGPLREDLCSRAGRTPGYAPPLG